MPFDQKRSALFGDLSLLFMDEVF